MKISRERVKSYFLRCLRWHSRIPILFRQPLSLLLLYHVVFVFFNERIGEVEFLKSVVIHLCVPLLWGDLLGPLLHNSDVIMVSYGVILRAELNDV